MRSTRFTFPLLLLATLSPALILGCSKNKPAAFAPAPAKTERLGNAEEKVIYGEDNRHEYFEEVDASVQAISESTVALIKNSQIGNAIGGRHEITADNYGVSYDLCPTERYTEQSAAAFCSGFLVGPNLIATAGHCIKSALDCSETTFVFDYAYKTKSASLSSADEGNVYRCKSVVHTEANSTGADFAIVEIDRPVIGRIPVLLRQSGKLNVGDDLTVIGHPAGLPMKIADGAKVRSTNAKDYFVANLDTYGGNSGSAVFNTKTHEVEGVLVRGETDFVWSSKGCATSYVCKHDDCRGEDVTKISAVNEVLQNL